MWNPRATAVFCCLASLPLVGCAAGPPVAWRPVPAAPIAAASDAPRVYVGGPSVPAAILVVLPGAGALGEDPALWTVRGFDVVAPAPDALRLAADREATIARMIASAQALADAPVWLLGPGAAVDAAMAAPLLRPGQLSGAIVTSLGAGAATCGRSVAYVDPGNGAEPTVTVETFGNACGPRATVGTTTRPRDVLPMPPSPNRAPKIIEASAKNKASASAQREAVEQLAALIRAAAS
jgi:hypothetical protein